MNGMDAEDASVVPGPSSLAGAELQGCEGLVAEGLAADDRDQSRHKSGVADPFDLAANLDRATRYRLRNASAFRDGKLE